MKTTTVGSDSNMNLRLTPVSLNGSNYLVWSRVASISLTAKGMLGYVNGKITAPLPEDEGFEEWRANDQLVMTWILNSIDPELHVIFPFSNTAKELWDSIEEAYGQENNFYRVFELKKAIAEAKQGEKSVTEHLCVLKCMWNELSVYRPFTTDLATLQKRAEEDKIFQLLSGLNPEYENLRSQILMNSELPSLANVFAMLRREETRKRIFSEKQEEPEETSACFSRFNSRENVGPGAGGSGSGRANITRDQITCDHCGKTGHDKDKCWFLHPHLKHRRERNYNGNASTAGASTPQQRASYL